MQYDPACPGSLRPSLGRRLAAIGAAYDQLDAVFDMLFGRRLPRSPIRDELMRLVLAAFAAGLVHNISHYQTACARLGSRTAIWRELQVLAELKVVILANGPKNYRAVLVTPTQHFVDWAERYIVLICKTFASALAGRLPARLSKLDEVAHREA